MSENKHLKNYDSFINESPNEDNNTLQEFFEDEGFKVDLYEQDGEQAAEIEKWTDGGVDMIINLLPFTKENFIEFVQNFDIDEEIDLHRQNAQYKKNFTISQSLKDFTDFHNHLKEVADKLEKIK